MLQELKAWGLTCYKGQPLRLIMYLPDNRKASIIMKRDTLDEFSHQVASLYKRKKNGFQTHLPPFFCALIIVNISWIRM